MCFDSQCYQFISILLNIHDLFSISAVSSAVSIVNFAVSIVNLLISFLVKYHEIKYARKGFFSAVYVYIQQEVLNHTVKEI